MTPTWPELLSAAYLASLTLVGPSSGPYQDGRADDVRVYRTAANGGLGELLTMVVAYGRERDARLRALVGDAIRYELDTALARKCKTVIKDRSIEPTGREP